MLRTSLGHRDVDECLRQSITNDYRLTKVTGAATTLKYTLIVMFNGCTVRLPRERSPGLAAACMVRLCREQFVRCRQDAQNKVALQR
jgi:hypothetical protein